jgi:hypothetical protein
VEDTDGFVYFLSHEALMTPTETLESPASAANRTHEAPKWAAIVDDALFPMPRRKLKASVISSQSGTAGRVLVRDFNEPIDVALAPDDEIDLAEGNVFRTVESCESPGHLQPHARPKLAFIADDAWEVTVQSRQTLESLRGLLDLPDDAELVRDFESPNDQAIRTGEAIEFADGPVFRTRIVSITVKVNRKPVKFTKRRVTGKEIKQTAIDQGVTIDLACVLYRLKASGEFGPAIGDDEFVTLKKCDEFRCVAPDDNS